MHATTAMPESQAIPMDAPYIENETAGMHSPLVIAHRGLSAHYPENTLPAFEAALEAGANLIELDVQLTRDRRLAVIHDETVDRTTNGRGRVRDLSLGELYQLDAGSWFSPKFTGTRIPGLEGVLRLLDGRCPVNIELKPPHDPSYSEKTALACATLGMVRSRGVMDSTIFSSFDHGLLRIVRRLEPSASLGVLSEDGRDPNALALVREIGATSFNPRIGTIDRDTIGKLHRTGVLVLCWAGEKENTPEYMEHALDIGADGFFANDVPVMLNIVKHTRHV